MNSLRPLIPLFLLLQAACSGVSDTRPEPVRKSEYYLEHGVSAFENSDYVAAADFLRKALAHYRSIDDTTGVLLSRINLAETALAAGNFKAALEQIEEAERIADGEPYHEYRPRLALLRAQTHWRAEEGEKALALLQPLLPNFESDGRSSERPTLLQLGAVTLRTAIAFARDDDERQEARLWLQRLALMLPRTEGRTALHHARLLRFEAQLAAHEEAPQTALEKFDQALQLYREGAARPAIAATLTESGKLLMQLGRWEEAAEQLQRALYIRLWIMDRPGAAELLQPLQIVYRQLGDEERLEQINSEANRLTHGR
ncbi:MAG: tetratricopeptide repeat protein [Gammaproteobacteria bacterium]|nr:tetratricopeptide repeat protein [Gammaproteobacteria bacterium]